MLLSSHSSVTLVSLSLSVCFKAIRESHLFSIRFSTSHQLPLKTKHQQRLMKSSTPKNHLSRNQQVNLLRREAKEVEQVQQALAVEARRGLHLDSGLGVPRNTEAGLV